MPAARTAFRAFPPQWTLGFAAAVALLGLTMPAQALSDGDKALLDQAADLTTVEEHCSAYVVDADKMVDLQSELIDRRLDIGIESPEKAHLVARFARNAQLGRQQGFAAFCNSQFAVYGPDGPLKARAPMHRK